MADRFVTDSAGNVRKVTDEEQASRLADQGKSFVSPEQAQRAVAQENARLEADARWGPGSQAAWGLGSGLTLGLGPAAAASLTGAIDPELGSLAKRDLGAMEGSTPYFAGELAGLVLPALASGGSALGARTGTSAIGRVFGATPAGLLGEIGSGAERLALSALPEASSALGKAGRSALSMAARGMAEGALIDVSNTIGKSIIHDQPLTAQTVLASGAEGALLGGLLGGGLGAAGSLVGSGLEAGIGTLAGAMVPKGEKAVGTVLKQLGANPTEIAKLGNSQQELTDAIKGFYKNVMEPAGLTFRSDASEIAVAARKTVDSSRTIQRGILDEVQRGAPSLVPDMGRVSYRLQNEAVAPFLGTFSEAQVLKAVDKLEKRLVGLGQKGGAGGFGTFEGWFDARNQIKELTNLVKDPTVAKDLHQRVLTVLDSELTSSLDAAGAVIGKPKLSSQWQAAAAQERLAEALEGMTSRKALSPEAGFGLTPGDLKTVGWSALMGGPKGLVGGLGLVGAKGIASRIQDAVSPILAQKAFEGLMGATAGASVQNTRGAIKKGVQGFFDTSRRGASYSYPKVTRESFDKTLERTSLLISPMHQEKVKQYAEAVSAMNQKALAQEILLTNARATQYLQANIPQSLTSKKASSLREVPKPHGLDAQEWKFLRIDQAIKNPLSLIDKLEDGQLTTDEVKAVKYVYPELHQEIVSSVSEHILEMKQEGKFLPIDKITHLGIVLDSPVDSFLEPEFVGQIQASLQNPPPEALPTEPQQGKGMVMQDLLTPLEKSLV